MERLGNKLAEADYDVTIAALMFKSPPSEGLYDVAKLPIGNLLKLKSFLKQFDVIHNHHPMTNYLALISNRPFIYHCHGVPDSGKGAFYRLNMLPSIKLIQHRLDSIIAISDVGGKELAQHFGTNKIRVLYNGVDTAVFKPYLEQKFKKGSPQLLFVGNLYEHKNVEELFFALKLLTKKYPNIHLQIVGAADDRNKKLKQLISKLKLEHHVQLVGRVSRFDLPHYYASCDVYVTASRWELFGLPLLEAMACGKPIVASSISAHEELLTKSKAGALYTIGNLDSFSKTLIDIYEKRESYDSNAINFAKEHDWSIVTTKLLKIYDQIM